MLSKLSQTLDLVQALGLFLWMTSVAMDTNGVYLTAGTMALEIIIVVMRKMQEFAAEYYQVF